MKSLKKYIIVMIASVVIITSCKDESPQVVPEWETGVHGFATVTSANSDLLYNDPAVDVDIDLKWISIDGKVTVNKMEVFVLFDEAYVDVDGNPKVASHGGTKGKLLKTFEGAAVPANRTNVSFSVSQAEVYNLYQASTFDYGNGSVNVFTNPEKPQRNATQRFMWDDVLTVKWTFTADDGRVFSSWAPSVCTEFPGANCERAIGVGCATAITNPGANGGQYQISMTDLYGDGWNGAAISVNEDGVITNYTIANGASSIVTHQAAPGAVSLTFTFVSGDWDSEVVFQIKSPKGNVIASAGPSPAPGPIKLNLCLE